MPLNMPKITTNNEIIAIKVTGIMAAPTSVRLAGNQRAVDKEYRKSLSRRTTGHTGAYRQDVKIITTTALPDEIAVEVIKQKAEPKMIPNCIRPASPVPMTARHQAHRIGACDKSSMAQVLLLATLVTNWP